MKIAITGTRGIPNHYGGFEQWAELLSKGLVDKGCEVYVYNSHNHPYQEKKWKGVNIIHKYDPEYKIGTAGQFIYDLNCILDSRKRKFDIILQLGYTSSSVWGKLLPKNPVVITNMDGIEWRREKFNKITQRFLHFAEKLAVNTSDILIADNTAIKQYYDNNYNSSTYYIPYGTTIFSNPDKDIITQYKLAPYKYNLLIARLEPENNIETIIKGVLASKTDIPLVIVGNYNIPHGKYLFEKYGKTNKIIFLSSIYNSNIVNNLRYFSNLYFHGHSVGGTNPSLLEAMACSSLICAHNNPYNDSVLNGNGYFFNDYKDIFQLLDNNISVNKRKVIIQNNIQNIKNNFLVDNIIDKYYNLFIKSHERQ